MFATIPYGHIPVVILIARSSFYCPIPLDFYSTPRSFSSLERSPDSFVSAVSGGSTAPASPFRLTSGPWHTPTDRVRKTLLIFSCYSQVGLQCLSGNFCWLFRVIPALEVARFPITSLCSLPPRHQ